MNPPMQNGIPPQWGGTQLPQKSPNFNAQAMNNGLGSSQSSRDSSPMSRLPAPPRGSIPPSQLPPGAQIKPSLNGPTVSSASVTPHSSPRMAPFSTSTPINNKDGDNVQVNKVSQPQQNVVRNLQQQPAFQQNMQHASSAPALPQIPPVKQNLNQNQNIQRPVSTGPPVQPNFEPLQNQSHFSQSQSQLQLAGQMTAPQQPGVPPHQQLLQQQSAAPPLLQQSVGPPLQQQSVAPPPLQQSVGPPLQQQSAAPPLQQQSVAPPPLQQSVGPPLQQQSAAPPLLQQSVGPPLQQQSVAPPHHQQLTTLLPNQQQSASPLHRPLMPLQQQIAPPLLHQQQSAPLPPHQQYAPVLQQQRQQFQNTVTSPLNTPVQLTQNQPQMPPPFVNQQPRLPPPINNQFVSTPQNIGPPSQIPQNANYQPMTQPQSLAQAPQVSNVSTPVSNLHAKRYPQPIQNQIPQQNVYQPQSQQNANVPATSYNNQQYQQPYNNQQQSNAYYQQQYQQQLNQQKNYQNLPQQMQNLNVTKSGFNKLWGQDNFDLLQCPNVLPEEQVEPPKVSLGQEYLDNANCSHEIFRCTMTKIPVSSSLLQKSRLPLGVLIHPFKDLNHLPVISCNTIVRCRACRTYINPFVFFVDTKRWKCNLCYRVNELPEEFQYDPVSKTYGDPSRRPEIKSSTIEYIAPSEYMLRPPQPAVYLFLLDISRLAIESGYLHTICEVLSGQLATLPGDARTQIGFVAYNSTLHFFSLAEGLSQPHEMIVSDIDDVFLPCPDNLLVNLKEHTDLVTDLLTQLPTRYQNSFDNGSALGAALQAAFKLMGATGGRVTVFQATLPQLGPGALTVREDPNQRAGKEAPHLNPAIDFYKRLALDCSGHQVAVDLFLLNSQYVDIATLSGISRFSGGCMYHFPLFKASKVNQSESLERCFRRYLTRKIGFEAVMRIRCTRGLAIHTFHGNFFVRSTDLLSLPNVNPDAGFGMQVSIEESLSDIQSVCFQAALLYTSSKGERRIRVHTLCLPVVSTLSDVLNSADQQCIVGLLGKMAVDRSLQSSLSDARDAFINVAIDILSSYKLSLNMGNSSNGLLAPQSLKLLPLYILALLKCMAFRTGQSTRLDDRFFAMCEMKTLPLPHLVQAVYPDLYPIYRLAECPSEVDEDGTVTPRPRRLQLTARNIDSHGAYLLDAGQEMIIFVCQNVSQQFLVHSLGVPNFNSMADNCIELQKIENPDNERLHAFINRLNDDKPYPAALQIMRENSSNRNLMLEHLIEDRIEYALSYNEFLQHLKTQVK